MKLAWVLGLGLLACGPVKGSPPGDDDVDGPVDDCETNTCECTAATEAADCGEHALCNEAGAGRVCECVSAYAKSGGAPCSFAGAPLDKGFAEADKWTAIDSTSSINTGAIGNLDPGEGVIDRVGVCDLGGFRQTFAMPPRAKAEPFKLSVTHSIVDSDFTLGGGVDVAIGGAWFTAASIRNAFKTDAICLGSRAYDGDKELLVQTTGNTNCAGASTSTFRIDQVAILPATNGECPADGTALNGEMDAQSDWVFNVISGATGEIQATGGESNGTTARIAATTTCSRASMTGSIALKDHTTSPNQAIEVFVNATTGERLTVALGDKQIGAITGTGTGKKFRVCVPSWAHGTHSPIVFSFQESTSGTCNASTKGFNIDSVTVVDEPNCDDVDVQDSGFENIANATGPVTGWGLNNQSTNLITSRAEVLSSGIAARTGTGSLRLSSTNECASNASARATFIVPAPAGAAGPAVKLFSNISSTNTPNIIGQAQVLLGGKVLVPLVALPENTAGYTQSIICLPPRSAGRRVTLELSIDHPGSNTCANNFAQENVFIDDVELTTDASCPAQ